MQDTNDPNAPQPGAPMGDQPMGGGMPAQTPPEEPTEGPAPMGPDTPGTETPAQGPAPMEPGAPAEGGAEAPPVTPEENTQQ